MWWRWLMISAAVALILGSASSGAWAVALTLPLLIGAGAVHYIPPAALARWTAEGWTVLADGLLISLALLGYGLRIRQRCAHLTPLVSTC